MVFLYYINIFKGILQLYIYISILTINKVKLLVNIFMFDHYCIIINKDLIMMIKSMTLIVY